MPVTTARSGLCAPRVHRPYDRPPLSKELLAGNEPDDTLAYRPQQWYDEHGVELLLGIAATAVRPGERRLELSDGERCATRSC